MTAERQFRLRFDLPPELIAQDPPAGARRFAAAAGRARRRRVGRAWSSDSCPDLLRPGDLLVLNDSRVLPARLLTVRERHRRAGGDPAGPTRDRPGHLAGAGPAGPAPAAGRCGWTRCTAPAGPTGDAAPLSGNRREAATAEICLGHGTGRSGRGGRELGAMPLPPYIRRDPEDAGAGRRPARDRERYQTVYAAPTTTGAGSVAAPTAGLHFSAPDAGRRWRAAGVAVARVTLHVGPGTFRPPTRGADRPPPPAPGVFPSARRRWPPRWPRPGERGGRVIAVGTTSLRVLETVARLELGRTPDPTTGTSGRHGGRSRTGLYRVRRHGSRDGWEVCGRNPAVHPPAGHG